MSEWDGELPQGWALTELKALSERCGGGTPSRSVKRYFQGLKIPWLTVADLPPIGTAPPTIAASREAITDEAIAVSSAKPIAKDSVVFATRVSIGKVAIAGCTLATNQDFRSLLPGPAHEPSYIAWFLSHIAQFNLPANQGTTIKGITTSKFDGIQVPLPPLAEQRRIVAKIEALQERSRRAREALSEVGPLLEQFRQSVLAAAFRGDLTTDWRVTHPNIEPACELLQRIRTERRRRWEQAELAKYEAKGTKPPKNWKERYKEPEPVDDSDLPELPEGWVWASLGQLIDGFSAGRNLNASGTPASDTEYGVLKVSAVTWGEFRANENKALLPGDFPKPHEIVGAGDLLISRANTTELVGAVVLVEADHPNLMLPDKILRIHYNAKATLPTYLLNALRVPLVRDYFAREATGTSDSMRNLSQPKLEATPIAVAPLEEQEELERLLRTGFQTISRFADLLARSSSEAAQLDSAVLAKAFRGDLVPQDPNDEPASVLLDRIRKQRAQQAEAAKARKKTAKTQPRNGMGKKSSALPSQRQPKADAQASRPADSLRAAMAEVLIEWEGARVR